MPQLQLPLVRRLPDGSWQQETFDSRQPTAPWVLFVYPRDNTPGCTIEVCGFRDLYAEFQRVGVEVYGLSRDTLAAHRKFIEKQNLPYALLSDEGARVLNEWGLVVPKTMYGKPVTGVARTTLLLDTAGIVRQIWSQVSPAGHAAAVWEAASTLSRQGSKGRSAGADAKLKPGTAAE